MPDEGRDRTATENAAMLRRRRYHMGRTTVRKMFEEGSRLVAAEMTADDLWRFLCQEVVTAELQAEGEADPDRYGRARAVRIVVYELYSRGDQARLPL